MEWVSSAGSRGLEDDLIDLDRLGNQAIGIEAVGSPLLVGQGGRVDGLEQRMGAMFEVTRDNRALQTQDPGHAVDGRLRLVERQLLGPAKGLEQRLDNLRMLTGKGATGDIETATGIEPLAIAEQ